MTDYKNTLNLPNTEFPMRGNLIKREPDTLQRWYKQNLYGIIRDAKKGKKFFILHDGPPYANGSIHIGHLVNKILKDIIIKFKWMSGYDSPYIPGWDCHGLPIELKVEQLIGKPGKKVSATEFRSICRQYAAKHVDEQKKIFIRVGVLGDWKHPYLTMNFNTEANIIRVLSKIISNGHLYKGAKPVHWCIDCRSALAEAEIEYYDRALLSIDVAFTATDAYAVAVKFGVINFTGKIFLVIWTTTPWTLPVNRAIAINPNYNYQLIEINRQGYILAANLVQKVMNRFGIAHWSILGCIKGSELELLRFQHPFMIFDVPIILSQHVTLDVGTGAVHIAPDHNFDDYIVSQQYGLKVSNSVGPDGCYLPGTLSKIDGLQIFKANDVIVDLLRNSKSLLHVEYLKHSYPHCWRHKTPIIFRATPQWFISMDKHDLRKQSLEEIKKVRWIPNWRQEHIEIMITKRPDWCISRQRAWGVPMALFVHNKTEELHPRTIELMENVAKLVEKHGIQAWWDLEPTDIIGDDATQYHKIPDTLDVWFDSGSTHFSVVAVHPEFKGHETDMYLEGSDQCRGWFMSSLMISTAIKGKAPYRQVLTHGFTVDSKGYKMSKSVGNVISPQQIIDSLGADILRLWVASTDYTGEMAISDEILKRSTDIYRRIRNTARFLLANIKDLDVDLHGLNPDQMVIIDRWAINKAWTTQIKIITAYDNYNFYNVIQYIMQFCTIEMGAFYLDIIKDRQYTTKSDSIARRSCQTAMYHIIEALVRWIAPIIPFTADEIWSFIPGKRSKYVFTEEWYDHMFKMDSTQPLNDEYWQILQQVRRETNKIIEKARTNKFIGGSLESHVTLYAEPILATQLRKLGNELNFALLTSSAIVEDYTDASDNAVQCEELKGLKILLTKATGKKCSRCWHYKVDIGCNTNYPEICGRCVMNVAGPGEKRRFV